MNRKIKVCHIITKLELGGAQQNTLYTVSHLNKDKFIPVLISGKGGILDAEASALPGIKVFFVSNLVRKISPVNDIISLIKIWLLLRKEKPGIVHTHSSKAGILGRWAAFFAGVPVIIHTFHGFGFHDFQKSPVKYLYALIERMTAKISKTLIAVSNDNIEKGLKNKIGARDKYILIRSGIDINRYKNAVLDRAAKKKELSVKESAKVITTIGPFKPQKNLKGFVEVAKKTAEKYQDALFLIVGDGEQKNSIESLIQRYDLTDKIKILGWQRDIAGILGITDIFVMTSLWEGLPRSIVEAMCMGIPVVANAVDGVKEAVRHEKNGYLVQPNDPEKMSELILKLLNNPQLRTAFGAKSRDLIGSQYDIKEMVIQQENTYLSLIL